MDDLFALLRPLYYLILFKSHHDGRVIMESSVQ